MRKRGGILLNLLIIKILRLKYLRALPAGSAVLPQNIFILMMVKNARNLSVKFALLYHKFILVIAIKLNIFALIAVIHFIFGKNERMHLSINAVMISVPVFLKSKSKLNLAERLLIKVKSS